MDEHGPGLEGRAPMVLRGVPSDREHLARAMVAPSVESVTGRWWEWVDAAADVHLPAAAVALTEVEQSGVVMVSALGVHEENADEAYDELLQALLAVLQRRCLDTVVVRSTQRRVVRALLAAGFEPDPDVDDRYVIAL